MPKKSGVEILKGFIGNEKNANKTKEVIIISGGLDQKLIKEIMAMGVKHFLVKPFSQDDFKQKIEAVVKTRKS